MTPKPSTSYLRKRRDQIDNYFNRLRKIIRPRPKSGWVAEIRESLQMTTNQLGRRLGVAQSVVSNFEKSERADSISLKTLSKIAEALNCELQYALVPKTNLSKFIMDQAKLVGARDNARLEHHMRLEGQATKRSLSEKLDQTIEAASLISTRSKRLWDDE